MNCSSTPPSIRILVVDDHGIVRDGLAALLEHQEGMQVVGCAATGEEAIRAAQRLMPEVIIMDLMMPDLNGLDATRRILREFPQTFVIALSACQKAEHVYRALRAGARGYVLKTAAAAELVGAVKVVAAGHQYVSPATGAVVSASVPKSPFERLSIREREVLRRIVAGFTSSDIAQHLSLSRKTVDTYRGRMMLKLGVPNRAALIRFALEYELPVA
jgi:DNA-binding NarL/FixJ family response regulator